MIQIKLRHPMHQAAYALAVARLQKSCGQYMRVMNGYEEIIAFFHELGITRGNGEMVTTNTIRTWIKKRGFPVMYITKTNGITTTNLNVLAWLESYNVYRRARQQRGPRA